MAKEKKTPAEEAAETQAAAENETVTADEAEARTAQAPAEDAEIAALREKVDELNDRLLRALAEYDNFRKRSQKEKEALYGDTRAETVAKFLPVMDNFERAASAAGDFESYKKGIEMTVKQFTDVLAGMQVTAFGEAGEPFDPQVHNGVMHEENESLGENTVADVFMKGYKMGDRVIRHATVKVAN